MRDLHLPRATPAAPNVAPIEMAAIGAGNVLDFPIKSTRSSPFDQLTTQLILDQHRRGTLQEGVLVALLAGIGLPA